jgi:hypothetical protein
MIRTGEFREKPVTMSLTYQKSHWTDLGMNPGYSCEKPVLTNLAMAQPFHHHRLKYRNQSKCKNLQTSQ